MHIAGFSGGARIALSYGQRNIVDGVIACGALTTRNQIITIRAPVYALIGMEDFNFVETAQYFFRPENTPANLSIELTGEIHEWPSEQELSNAIAFFLLSEADAKIKCLDVKILQSELAIARKNQIDILKNKGDFISALQIAKTMSRMQYEYAANHFQALLNSIEYSQELNEELSQLRESIRFELTVRDTYMNALLIEDLAWWENEVSSLNKNIRQDKDKYRNLALKRIKAFLGIMCYTVTGKTIQSNDLDRAKKLLSVYELLEPHNPDMFYFNALYFQKKGNEKEAKMYLRKAIDAGFSNQEMIDRLNL